MPVTIFFCYAREDETLLLQLKSHLRLLQRQGLIDVWHDRDISAGMQWEHEINQHLNTTQIILLLVSPDFMNSEYCYGIEMKRALERHERGETRVIPIILRPTYWHGEPLGKLQVLPKDGTPVTASEWSSVDEALYDVTNSIYNVAIHYSSSHTSDTSFIEEEMMQVEDNPYLTSLPYLPSSSKKKGSVKCSSSAISTLNSCNTSTACFTISYGSIPHHLE